MAIRVFRPSKFLVNTVPIPFSNLNIEPGFAEFLQQNGIVVDPTYVGVQGIAPIISVDTFDIELLVGTVGFAGLTSTTFECHFIEIASGAVAAPGNTAVKVAGTVGLAVISGITASGGENATEAVGSMELHALGTATVAPLVVTDLQTPPAAVDLAQVFYLADVTFNGSSYEPLNVSIQPALEVAKRMSAGNAWPTFAGVPRRAAQITISTENMIALADMSTGGAGTELEGALVADVEIFFRQGLSGTARTAAATLAHLKVTAASAMVTPAGQGGALDGFATSDVTIRPLSDSGGASLVFTPDQAIA